MFKDLMKLMLIRDIILGLTLSFLVGYTDSWVLVVVFFVSMCGSWIVFIIIEGKRERKVMSEVSITRDKDGVIHLRDEKTGNDFDTANTKYRAEGRRIK